MAYPRHCHELLGKVARQIGQWVKQPSVKIGMELYELLPEQLQDRWGQLKPNELALLATVFPEELPPDARRLLEADE